MKYPLNKFIQAILFLCVVVSVFAVHIKAEADTYEWPCGGEIISRFGYRDPPETNQGRGSSFHRGLDFAVSIGTPVIASAAGTVAWAEEVSGYGYMIGIYHPTLNSYTCYAHLSQFVVSEGDTVSQKQLIAYSGASGNVGGPHLHFEIRVGGSGRDNAVNPEIYLKGVPDGPSTPALDSARAKFKWDKEHDFSKPIFEDIIQPITKMLVDAWKKIKDVIKNLLIIILTIDIALAASLYTINPKANDQQYGIFGFLIGKLLLFGILIWLVSSWGGTINNLMRDFAIYSAGTALNKENAEITKFMQEPFDIMTKGISIISPFFESAVMMALGDPVSIILFLLMLIMGSILVIIFFFISYNIVMAYLGFYFSALFGFCTVFLSGFKYTRHHAEKGINGIFYATIKLFVFSFAGFIILGLMKEFAVDPFVKQEMTTTSIAVPTDGNFGGEEGVRVVSELIMIRESSGDPKVYNVRGDLGGDWSRRYEPTQGDGGYGLWQFTFGNYEEWGKQYEAAHGGKQILHRVSEGCDPTNSPNQYNGTFLPLTGDHVVGSASGFSYCADNQRKIAEFMFLKRYKETGDWKQVIAGWNPNDPDYYNKVINGATGTIHRPQASVVIDFYIIFKLFVIALIFVYIFSKLNKTLESLLGGNGFRFTTRDFS